MLPLLMGFCSSYTADALGKISVTFTLFENLYSDSDGGAISISNSDCSLFYATFCTFNNCSSLRSGGAVFANCSSINLEFCCTQHCASRFYGMSFSLYAYEETLNVSNVYMFKMTSVAGSASRGISAENGRLVSTNVNSSFSENVATSGLLCVQAITNHIRFWNLVENRGGYGLSSRLSHTDTIFDYVNIISNTFTTAIFFNQLSAQYLTNIVITGTRSTVFYSENAVSLSVDRAVFDYPLSQIVWGLPEVSVGAVSYIDNPRHHIFINIGLRACTGIFETYHFTTNFRVSSGSISAFLFFLTYSV